MFFDFRLLIFTAPALLLMIWAQYRLRSTYAAGMKVRAPLSGAAAAQHILEQAGVDDVGIEMTHQHLGDHYDPAARMLRLSPEVYEGRTATAVGIAAHEAGHALQHAQGYALLSLRNAAVPAAQFGPMIFMGMVILGVVLSQPRFLMLGLIAYSGLVVFQLINLPVEFDASARAKRHLADLGIVDDEGALAVRKVLTAAALTYVAATLESLLTVIYYFMRFSGSNQSDD
ncbi:MAG: zinc metallopeptidase [Planctomycetota bacterium]|nr:MAG: zinc metallopeptidase [Planctomycetota bacterium]